MEPSEFKKLSGENYHGTLDFCEKNSFSENDVMSLFLTNTLTWMKMMELPIWKVKEIFQAMLESYDAVPSLKSATDDYNRTKRDSGPMGGSTPDETR